MSEIPSASHSRSSDDGEIDLLPPLTIVRARVVGGITIRADDEAKEHKLIGVAIDDPSVSEVADLSDVSRGLRHEIREFFDRYKDDEGVTVKVTDWFDRARSLEILRKAFRAAKTPK